MEIQCHAQFLTSSRNMSGEPNNLAVIITIIIIIIIIIIIYSIQAQQFEDSLHNRLAVYCSRPVLATTSRKERDKML